MRFRKRGKKREGDGDSGREGEGWRERDDE